MIGIDIDEVLFPFVEEFSIWHNQEYGTELTASNFNSYEFENILQVDIPETIHRVHSFLRQEHAHLGVSPLHDAQDAIARLSEDYTLAAITARHPEFEHPTKAYLLRHFGDSIGAIRLVGHKETMDKVLPKSVVCKEIGAIALIDDSIPHVLGCADNDIQGVLFGSYPWNKLDVLPENIIHCPSWQEVLNHFNGRS